MLCTRIEFGLWRLRIKSGDRSIGGDGKGILANRHGRPRHEPAGNGRLKKAAAFELPEQNSVFHHRTHRTMVRSVAARGGEIFLLL
jgi:hypothetical protein